MTAQGVELEPADPELWPIMPVDVRPLEVAPPVGWWVWIIPERVRHSCFHRIVAVENIAPDDEPTVTVVEATCGLAWPLEAIAAAVPWHSPILNRIADTTHARCRNCASGSKGRRRRTLWGRKLAEHRLRFGARL